MPRFPRNIVLLGLRGAGKSTVGRALAEQLGRHFVDTDEMASDWEGLSIPQIFAAYGEDYFRELESRVVVEVTGRGGKVIATGGGVVLRDANVARLRGSGLTCWLRATPATLRQRLTADPIGLADRPALLGDDALAELDALAAGRAARYAAAADHVLDTDGWDLDACVRACAAWVAQPGMAADYDPTHPCTAPDDPGQ